MSADLLAALATFALVLVLSEAVLVLDRALVETTTRTSIGLGLMVQMAATNTVLQTIVDDDKRGRVMSFYSMAFMGMVP